MTRKHLSLLGYLYAHTWYRTAIEVVKTRIQIDPVLARHSILSGGRLIVTKEGPSEPLTGFGPTAVGYLFLLVMNCGKSSS